MKKFIKRAYFFCIPTLAGRINYIRKHDVFDACGDNFFFQPRKLPADPKMIRFHDNVVVAADVTFVNHDAIYAMLRNISEKPVEEHFGCIEVMDNVFIGLGSIILPNVRIGENVIVSAGSVVTKDVPPNSIVGGVPAKVIGSFDALVAERMKEALVLKQQNLGQHTKERISYEWKHFEESRKG